MKLYREVKASERMPEDKEKIYVYFTANGKSHGFAFGSDIEPSEIWLEPIEITEEEIEEVVKYYETIGVFDPLRNRPRKLFAQAILSKLKGE
jgi:hypothetical protein